MSRIGKQPVVLPAKVQVTIDGHNVQVKGPKGQLTATMPVEMTITQEEGILHVTRPSDGRRHRELHGLTRALIANMVTGVNTGYRKVLVVEGVGYRAEMQGKDLALHVGYSHPVIMQPPAGISFETDAKTRQVKVLGFDKELVGQIAANIRKVRTPEPYHGKGIHYLGEHIRRKAGKAGKGAAK